MRSPQTEDGRVFDPDPLVVDLLVGMTGSALAGAIKKVGQLILARRSREEGTMQQPISNEIEFLRGNINQLDHGIEQALELVRPGQKRELGGQLLLDREAILKYHELRESLFNQVRSIDNLVEALYSEERTGQHPNKPSKFPKEFREQLKFIERKLREARTAAFSDAALLEVRSAVAAMTRLLDYVELSH